MFGRFFSGTKYRQAGFDAAQAVIRIADPTAPYLIRELSAKVGPFHEGLFTHVWRVFSIDYILQNIWKKQMPREECVEFIDGLISGLDPLEKKLLQSLSKASATLHQSYSGSYPSSAYMTCMGNWLLQQMEVRKASDEVDEECGAFVVEMARAIADRFVKSA